MKTSCIRAFVMWAFLWVQAACRLQNNGIQISHRLRQESVPSIEYKYVIKTIFPHPKQTQWWKRGTHRIYVPKEDGLQVVFA